MGESTSSGAKRQATESVEILIAITGERYDLVGPLTGGETGATEIRRADGGRYVLKWELDPRNWAARRDGAGLAERLRTEARWPCPVKRIVSADDRLLIVQEFMPGTTVAHLTHEIVDGVLNLHQARLGLGDVDDSAAWGEEMARLLIEGGNGYCLHEPLRAFSPATRRVVERIEEIGRSTQPADLVGHDIVHADLHPGNLLHVDGRLAAVVDMDFTQRGDALFDLTMLAVSSLETSTEFGVPERLLEMGVWQLPDPKRRAYVANLLLRHLDWGIRKNRTREVDFWLERTEWLLAT